MSGRIVNGLAIMKNKEMLNPRHESLILAVAGLLVFLWVLVRLIGL